MTVQMGSWSLGFLPHIPWAWFVALCVVGAIVIAAMLYARMRGGVMRAAGLALLLAAIANPQLAEDDREQLSDIAAVVRARPRQMPRCRPCVNASQPQATPSCASAGP
jgi:hypothetical protein